MEVLESFSIAYLVSFQLLVGGSELALERADLRVECVCILLVRGRSRCESSGAGFSGLALLFVLGSLRHSG